jgi:hypothetical protein
MILMTKRLGFLLGLLGGLLLIWMVLILRQPSTGFTEPKPVAPLPGPSPVVKKEEPAVGGADPVNPIFVDAGPKMAAVEVLDQAALPDPVATQRVPQRTLTRELMAEFVLLTLLALKEERRIELWGHQDSTIAPELLRVYPFTGFSGTLGPKLREGDGQIPEGIYRIEYLNPQSSYHRSMKLDYPNGWDRAMGLADERPQLGFDIFIHGSFLTIGCIPIGDEAIEELFTVVEDFGHGRVEVIIAPWDFRVREDSPEIEEIDWEGELYARVREVISERLLNYPQPGDPGESSAARKRD